MIQVDWLTSPKVGMKFLGAICKDPNCLELFNSKTINVLTNYMWNITRTYFIYWYFLPFLILGFVPLLMMSFSLQSFSNGKESSSWFVWFMYYGATFLFLVGTIMNISSEIADVKTTKFRRYIRNPENYM